MSAQSETPNPHSQDVKGKGKAPVQHQGDDAMDEDDDEDDSDEDEVHEDEIAAEEDDEDNMEEIDTSNIVGHRTRGKDIDFKEAAANAPDLDEDDDEEDDEDFKDDDEDEEMK